LKTKPLIVAFAFLFVVLGVIYLLVGRQAPVRANSLQDWTNGRARPASPMPAKAAAREGATPAAGGNPSTDGPRNNLDRLPPAAKESFMKGTAAFQENRYADAVAAFQIALQQDPSNPLIHLALAKSYEGLKDWENAYRSMKTFAELARGAKGQ
jgi:cytochrome c-type biogenesis protein CcmH/NrfG